MKYLVRMGGTDAIDSIFEYVAAGTTDEAIAIAISRIIYTVKKVPIDVWNRRIKNVKN